jgi:hypothetical protein
VYRTPKEVVRALLRQEKNKQFKGHVDFPHTRTPVLSMVDYSMELYYSKVHESGFEFPFALQKHRDLLNTSIDVDVQFDLIPEWSQRTDRHVRKLSNT